LVPRRGKFVLRDLGANELVQVPSQRDAEMKRPLHSKSSPAFEAGKYRLYMGREFVEFSRIEGKLLPRVSTEGPIRMRRISSRFYLSFRRSPQRRSRSITQFSTLTANPGGTTSRVLADDTWKAGENRSKRWSSPCQAYVVEQLKKNGIEPAGSMASINPLN